MEILADENVRRDLVVALRAMGHDVQWISEIAPGAPDKQVFEIAAQTGRILLTADRDFNEIVYRNRRRGLSGLIQLRIDVSDRAQFLQAATDVWALVQNWQGVTTVLMPGRFRQRPLP